MDVSTNISKVSCTFSVESETDGDNLCTLLGSLPTEILQLIFNLLPIDTLLLLQHSQKEWIQDLTLRVRTADLRTCCLVNEQTLKFVSVRAHYLTEMNLDNLSFVKPLHLFKLVKKCKQLRRLSVRYCKFTLLQIYVVLHALQNLLRFSCTLEGSLHPRMSPAVFPSSSKALQKLAVDVYSPELLIAFIGDFSSRLNGLKELHINCCVIQEFSDIAQPLAECESFPSFLELQTLVLEIPNGRSIGEKWYSLWLRKFCVPLMTKIGQQMKSVPVWKNFSVPFSHRKGTSLGLVDNSFKALSSASQQLIIATKNNEIVCNVLDLCPQNSVEVLGVSTHLLEEKQVESIQKAGGKHLQKFAAVSYKPGYILVDAPCLDTLFRNCCNITCLNISGVHIRDRYGMSVCAAICALKDLRKLSVSVCAIADVRPNKPPVPSFLYEWLPVRRRISHAEGSQAAVSNEGHSAFGEIVECCKYVQVFCITGCRRCGLYLVSTASSTFNDSTLKEIHNWSHLKRLRIDFVFTLRQCPFLPKIASQCSNFTTLELINVGVSAFHLTQSLIQVLKHSKSLRFLRIVQKFFNYSDKAFWSAMAHAKNMRGICISTNFSESVSTSSIVTNVPKLKHLLSFHLYCCLGQLSPSLESKLRRVISNNYGLNKREVDVIVSSVRELTQDNNNYWLKEPMCPSGHCCEFAIF